MEFDYTCRGTNYKKSGRWKGHIFLIKSSDPYEAEVTARNSSFHIICGKHEYGSFICIPNWNIGTELAALSDRFWNYDRLTNNYPNLSPADAVSIVEALVKLNEYISIQREAG